ncbi:hypothetical protein T07_12253 [Trichinella nelsoni]|uniref:Uncharacterized protein n=1 Tax=Trichinella nelsoni TaxID=6336 RepID=A0A0V0RHB9_9BILA|nr:hypothetical protein T07_12253 [Trichinella nelsoni]
MILTATSDSAETVHRNDSCRVYCIYAKRSRFRDEDRQGAETQREDAFNISIATPQAMPQAIFRKFRNFKNIAPGFALRLRPRANKNLHIPSGNASGVTPRGICKFLFALGRSLRATPGAIFLKFRNF